MKIDNNDNFMKQALELALKGLGSVAPNPMVGAVIVQDEKIIACGYHMKYGENHAEVNAINDLKLKYPESWMDIAKQSEIYVTLEPCCHFGKTPPCTNAILEAGFKKVTVACEDPNPKVAGRGIKILQDTNIEVTLGILKNEAIELNKRFFTQIQKNRPYIILKWAETADGFIARVDGTSKWISSPESRKLVHQWRSEEAGILVGYNTVVKDNPLLTVRDVIGKNPVRIVLDKEAALDKDLSVFNSDAETIHVTKDFDNTWQLVNILNKLSAEPYKMQSILVEGGAKTLQWFIDTGLWDEARVFTCKNIEFKTGILSPSIDSKVLINEIKIGSNKLSFIKPGNTNKQS